MAVNSSVVPVKNTSKSFLQSNYPVFVTIIADFKLLCFLDCSILLKYTDLKSKHTDLNVLLDLQKIISDNCVVIFSKTTCFYCKMSKKLFEDMNVNYTAVELDMNTNGSQFQDILEQMTGGRTVSIFSYM